MPNQSQPPRSLAERPAVQDAEQQVTDAAQAAMAEWLALVRDAILTDPADELTAATWRDWLNLDTWPEPAKWAAIIAKHVGTVLRDVFTLAWNSYTTASQRAQQGMNPDATRAEYVSATINQLAQSTFPADVWTAVTRARDTANETDEPDDELRGRIVGTLNPDQWADHAELIGRTEANGAFNAGAFDAGQQRQDVLGETLYKQFWATTDQRTRNTHRIAHRQVRGYDEPFLVGGYDLRWPHDPLAPPQETINCRCALLVIEEDEVEEQRDLYERYLQNTTDVWGNPLAAAGWDPSEHPRGSDGQFTETPAADQAPAAVPPPTVAKRTTFTDWLDDAQAIEQHDAKDPDGDQQLLALWQHQGFDGQPTVVTSEQFDALTTPDSLVLHRGLSGANAQQYADQFQYGDTPFAGFGGMGNGTYASTSGTAARGYAKTTGTVVRMALKPDARTTTKAEMFDKQNELFGQMMSNRPTDETRALTVIGLGDLGHLATMLGYDAYYATSTSPGDDYWVVLNRTAVITDEDVNPT